MYWSAQSQSQSVSLGVEPNLGLTRYLLLFDSYGLFSWGVLSDERMCLSFVYAVGPRQCCLSLVWVPWDSWPYFTVSDLRLPFSSPPTTRRITFEVFEPASRVIYSSQSQSYIVTDGQSVSLSQSRSYVTTDGSVGQSGLVSSTHLGLTTRSLLLSDSCYWSALVSSVSYNRQPDGVEGTFSKSFILFHKCLLSDTLVIQLQPNPLSSDGRYCSFRCLGNDSSVTSEVFVLIVDVFITQTMIQETWLPSHCLAMDVRFDSYNETFRRHATILSKNITLHELELMDQFLDFGWNFIGIKFDVTIEVTCRKLIVIKISVPINSLTSLILVSVPPEWRLCTPGGPQHPALVSAAIVAHWLYNAARAGLVRRWQTHKQHSISLSHRGALTV
jgi:hypothetical protein